MCSGARPIPQSLHLHSDVCCLAQFSLLCTDMFLDFNSHNQSNPILFSGLYVHQQWLDYLPLLFRLSNGLMYFQKWISISYLPA
jgi:hypothetical protein